MGDWLRLSKQDAALLHSCTENEGVVLLDGNWTKMPRKMIGMMTMDAQMRATEDALVKLGVKYELKRGTGNDGTGHGFRLLDGVSLADLGYDSDIESEVTCVTVTLIDGRKQQGFAKLQRMRPN